ncbi:MAG: hypothetical protein ACLQGV_20160 [Bryobacteraceae bacterium]
MSFRSAGLIALISASAVLLAGEFWQDKQPSEWTEKEIQRLKTRSPWAKEAILTMGGSHMGQMDRGDSGGLGGGARGMGGMGGPGSMGGGGGMGGPGGGAGRAAGGADNPAVAAPKVIIRWDSAAPLRDVAARAGAPADVKNIADWSKEFYVVTVSGLSNSRYGGGGGQETLDSERIERLKMLTVLRIKGKNSVSPARIETFTTPEGPATSFLFSRDFAIGLDDKELSFETQLGPNSVKMKFTLKDMLYHGKLEL